MGDPRAYPIPRKPRTEPWTAERVAKLRRQLRLSQSALAERMGIRQQTVSEWETGRYRPRGASAKLLAMLAEESAPYDADDHRGPNPAPSERKGSRA